MEKVSEEKNAGLAVGEVESLLEFMSCTLETSTDQELLSLKKQMSDQVDQVSSLYDNPAGKFPAPELPLVTERDIGMDEVSQHHAHTFEKSNLNFQFLVLSVQNSSYGQHTHVPKMW